MASPFVRSFSTAYKRARSHDSPTPLASPPAPKATKVKEETGDEESRIPAFLRQPPAAIRAKFQDLVWREKLRILQGRNDSSSQWAQEVGPHVTKRNRYINVQPWEKSRVRLKVAEGKSDYINASPISLRDPLTSENTNYIATQGPKQSGTSHFWHMVWQETKDVAVIIMLTQTHDGATEKCFQYFPLTPEAGPFTIEPFGITEDSPEGVLTFVETLPDSNSKIEIRRLSLTFGDETRDVWHFFFSGWPDHSAPEDEDRAALLELLRLSAEKNSIPSNPRIIHCSAGVGRSGTFIALEHLLANVDAGSIAEIKDQTDIIHEVVDRLREQRMLMVQSEEQYRFLYDVVLEEYQRKEAAVLSGQHSPKLRKLASGMEATLLCDTDEKEDAGQRRDTDPNQSKATENSNDEEGEKVIHETKDAS
ncbi:hypothetical protein ACLMJK_000177 [Lecanora helva]